jgi:hypothetical protein
MRSQRFSLSRIAPFGVLAVVAIGFALSANRPGNAGQPPVDGDPAPPPRTSRTGDSDRTDRPDRTGCCARGTTT